MKDPRTRERRENRDTPEPRTVPVQDTGLWRGLKLEIHKLEAKIVALEAENAQLRQEAAQREIEVEW